MGINVLYDSWCIVGGVMRNSGHREWSRAGHTMVL